MIGDLKFEDGPFPLKIEGVKVEGPGPNDPLGQRVLLGVKFQGGITTFHTERPPSERERARVDFEAVVALCEEIYRRCFLAMQFAVTEGRSAGNAPKSAAGKLRDELYAAEAALKKATERAKLAEAQRDELRRIFAPQQQTIASVDTASPLGGVGGGINGIKDREV